MGIFKLVVIVLLLFVGFYLFKRFRNPSSVAILQPSTDKMVACHACKMHIPENEAIMHDGRIYCSKECL
ncbi:MAG: hypothetical protein FE834_00810 [Gammaproteobacteria bacterium]|nr:hypothetical protein [Gammaproteobacteria bacterium]